MPNTQEQRIDIITYCDYLLDILKHEKQTDDTPYGRMITQLHYFRDRAIINQLHLPVDRRYTSTIGRVYMDGYMRLLASKKDEETIVREIEIPMARIMKIADGYLLAKPEYEPFIPRCLKQYIKMIQPIINKYPKEAQDSFPEVQRLLINVQANKVKYPAIGWSPDNFPLLDDFEYYTNRITVISGKYNIDVVIGLNCAALFTCIENLILNDIRPHSWLTVDDAEREVQRFERGDMSDLINQYDWAEYYP